MKPEAEPLPTTAEMLKSPDARTRRLGALMVGMEPGIQLWLQRLGSEGVGLGEAMEHLVAGTVNMAANTVASIVSPEHEPKAILALVERYRKLLDSVEERARKGLM